MNSREQLVTEVFSFQWFLYAHKLRERYKIDNNSTYRIEQQRNLK